MTELEALRVLQISESEVQGLTMVKLSRQFARVKRELDEESEEYEKLFDAFEYMKKNMIQIKNATKNVTFPDDLFPVINTGSEEKTMVGMVLNLEVEGTPTELSFAKAGNKDIFIHMPHKTETQDTITFIYDKQIYEGSLIVKNISQKEHEEFVACQNQ